MDIFLRQYILVQASLFPVDLPTFHNLDFFLSQPVQLVHQPVNLPVCGLDLARDQLFDLRYPKEGA